MTTELVRPAGAGDQIISEVAQRVAERVELRAQQRVRRWCVAMP
jgi:hypothetical protein